MIQRLRESGSPALAVLATISFISSLGISIMLPLLPLYALSLGASPLQLGLMTSGFAIANGVAQFASGFLMDRWGARRFVVGRGVANVQPKLHAGTFVKLTELGDLFSGKYYVTEVRQVFDRAGLRTEFTAERAGIGRGQR